MPKQFEIYGGGLLSVCIASQILQRLSDSRISIYERGASLLSSWKSTNFGSQQTNPGFHGLEMPRAQKTFECLNSLGAGEFLTSIKNRRLLCIRGKNIWFGSPVKDWPESLTQGIDFNCVNEKSDALLFESVHSPFAVELLACHNRFNNNLKDSWPLVYPWFFPAECEFNSPDEGAVFQDSVRSGRIDPWYSIPENGLFESLIAPIHQSLANAGVELIFNHDIAPDALSKHGKNSDSVKVWGLSSYGILKVCNDKLAQECLTDRRAHTHILLSIDREELGIWKSGFDDSPSEILYLDQKVSEINRLSFVEPVMGGGACTKHSLLLVECILQDDTRPADVVHRAVNYLREYFDSASVALKDSKTVRTAYTFSSEKHGEAIQEVQNFALEHDLIIPSIFFSPINMAKCGIIASEFIEQYSNEPGRCLPER